MTSPDLDSTTNRLGALLRLAAELVGRPFPAESVGEAIGGDDDARDEARLVRGLERLGLRARRHETSSALLLETTRHRALFVALDGEGGAPSILEPIGGRVRVHAPEDGVSGGWSRRWVDAEGLARSLGRRSAEDAIVLFALDDRAAFETSDAESDDHASPLGALVELLAYERDDVAVVAIYAVAVGVFALVTPLAVQALVSTVAFGTLLQPILVLGAMVLGFLAAGAVLRTLQAWVVEVLQRRLFVRTAASLAERLPRLDLRAGDETRHAEALVPRFLEVVNAQKAAASLLLDGLEAALTAVVGLIVLAFYHPMLLTFDLLLLVALAGVVFALGRSGVRTSIDESVAKYDLVAWLQTVASRPHSLRNEGGAAFAVSRADDRTRAWLGARGRHFDVVHRQRIGALAVQAAASAGLLVVGGYLVVDEKLTLGQLVAAELIVSAVAASLTKLAKHAESFYDLVTAVGKLAHLDHLPLERERGDTRGLGVGPASLKLAGIRFSAVDGVELEVRPGEHLVVRDVDDGAAARSLLFAFGIEPAEAGVALVDGLDVTSLDPRRLRERIALVREPDVWPATVLENVLFGRPELAVRDAQAALARLSHLDAVLAAPGGFGRRLIHADAIDGREAVAIAIARATVGRPGLLVLDGTLDRLAPEEAEAILAALVSDETPWTLVVRSRMALRAPAGVTTLDLRAASDELTHGGSR